MEEKFAPINNNKWYSTAPVTTTVPNPNMEDVKYLLKDVTSTNYVLDVNGNYVYRDKTRQVIIFGIVFSMMYIPIVQRLIAAPFRFYLGYDFQITQDGKPTVVGMFILTLTFMGFTAFLL